MTLKKEERVYICNDCESMTPCILNIGELYNCDIPTQCPYGNGKPGNRTEWKIYKKE